MVVVGVRIESWGVVVVVMGEVEIWVWLVPGILGTNGFWGGETLARESRI